MKLIIYRKSDNSVYAMFKAETCVQFGNNCFMFYEPGSETQTRIKVDNFNFWYEIC